MNFSLVQNKISGIRRRFKCIKYGMFYLRNSDFEIPKIILVNAKKRSLKFKNLKDQSFIGEFIQICLNDCYHLDFLKKKLRNVETIIDIGANQGLFLVAARQNFEKAQVICYEPNIQLQDYLNNNARELNATVHYEAVMKNDCLVELDYSESDLATRSFTSAKGNILGTAFKKIVESAGTVDILKMDCEGGEWELLEDIDSWLHIKSLAMEYHLWGLEASIKNLEQLLKKINFYIVYHTILSGEQGLIIALNRKN